jgi:hypothetical protein
MNRHLMIQDRRRQQAQFRLSNSTNYNGLARSRDILEGLYDVQCNTRIQAYLRGLV